MAQIQKLGKKEKIERLRTLTLGATSVYMMGVIAGFSSDPATVSRGKSLVLASFFERLTRGFTSTLFSYNTEEFISIAINIVRKFAHIAEFFMLGALFVSFAKCITARLRRKLPALLAILFAASDELHQAFVPGRGPSLSDVAVDTVGVVLAVVVLSHFFRKRTYYI